MSQKGFLIRFRLVSLNKKKKIQKGDRGWAKIQLKFVVDSCGCMQHSKKDGEQPEVLVITSAWNYYSSKFDILFRVVLLLMYTDVLSFLEMVKQKGITNKNLGCTTQVQRGTK